MNNLNLTDNLILIGRNNRDANAFKDALSVLHTMDEDCKSIVFTHDGRHADIFETDEILDIHKKSAELREAVRALLAEGRGDTDTLLQIDRDSLLFDAPHNFDAFCQYMEIDREPERRFYYPRRPQLLPIVRALERLERDELDILGISLGPGTGKSETALFYLAWVGGRSPDLANLIVSHSGNIVHMMYDELRRLLSPRDEYKYKDIFPNAPIRGASGDLLTIDLERRRRFPTYQFTSLGSSNAGRVRAMNLLYCDDLVTGIEQAMNPVLMDKLWRQYTVDAKQRGIGDKVKELHIATRWSQTDVIGRLEAMHRNDPRALFLNYPIMDAEGHSLFNYPYGLGYDDARLKDLQESMDDAAFQALYMGEPYERDGQLYGKEELRRYLQLPDREPDAVIAVCDTKTTGQDYCVLPIVYVYGSDYYVDDVVCENYAPDVVENSVFQKLLQHKVQQAQFESNVAGGKMAQVVQERINQAGGITAITTKWTQSHKETKIQVNAPWVKMHCLFRDDSIITGREWSEYRLFMRQLQSYSLKGRNAHDDVPDAMAQLALYVTKQSKVQKVKLVKRWF